MRNADESAVARRWIARSTRDRQFRRVRLRTACVPLANTSTVVALVVSAKCANFDACYR
jgi:hypothetical protein